MKLKLVAVLEMDVEAPVFSSMKAHLELLKRTMADSINEKLFGDLTVTLVPEDKATTIQ